jgi:hypothetical protein
VRALAAAEDQQREAGTARRRRRCEAAHRVAGEHDLVGREVAVRLREGGADAARQSRQRAIGHAGVRVLLEQHGWNASEPGGDDHRDRRVAADAEHHIGAELADDAPRTRDRGGQLRRQLQRAAPAAPAQAVNGERAEGETRLRDDARLDAGRAADEQHGACVAAGNALGDRQSREEMPTRTTTRHDHAHPQPVMRESAANKPTSSMVASSAEPP